MVRTGALAVGSAVGAVLLVTVCGRGHAARRRRHLFIGRVHHVQGRAHGLWYRVRGRHPDEHVDDLVLADRIRSTIGPLEHALDQPRVHVSVYQHVATLHGDVANDYAAERLESEVRSVAGVVGVRSHLHVGLLPGDGCPSDALAQSPLIASNRGRSSLPGVSGSAHDAGMQSETRPQETPETRGSVPVDAERPVEDIDDELVVPLEAPIETPVGDLIDQRRSAPLEDPDEH